MSRMAATRNPPKTGPSDKPQPGRLRQILREFWFRTKTHPIRTFFTIAFMIGSVVGLAVIMPHLLVHEQVGTTTEQLLRRAMSGYDEGRLGEARDAAADLRLRTDIPAEEKGVPAYVLGTVMYEEALDEWQERERQAYFLLAARYLTEAQQAGFPHGREGNGYYLLGKSLHGCGRYAEALPPLLAALEKNGPRRTEICGLLADTYLSDRVPNLDQAAKYNAQYLADTKLSPEDRDAALLIQAKITFDLGRFEECQKQLDQFTPESAASAEVLLLRGRLKLKAEDFSGAREIFAKAQDLSFRNGPLMRQAQYLQGLSLRKSGDLLAAELLFSRNRRSYLDTPEGMASGLEEAEVQHQLGNEIEALAAYRRVLKQISQTPARLHPWVGDEELRERLDATVGEFLAEQQFDAAFELLQAVSTVFADAHTVEQLASLHQQWGDRLMAQAAAPQAENSADLRTQARSEYRLAGVDFGRLAHLRVATREYPNDLWRSAENYLRGQDYPSAIRVYQRHLENLNRAGRSPALTRIGECLLALNQPAEALQYVRECIEFFPKDPFVYQARLIAAEAEIELEHLDAARDLLIANLENESLTPQSREWRDSLFALGRVYYHNGMLHESASRRLGLHSPNSSGQQAGLKELELAHASFREAIERLDEAIQREPQSPHALEGRYLLAISHMQSAKLPKWQLNGVNIESTRVTLRRQLQRELSAAIGEFDQLKADLVAKQERADLTEVEQRILRNAYFGKADALFDLDMYEDAIQAYSSATNRYQQAPESLEAYVQIAVCQRKLDRLADSRRTLEQARLVLGRMPADASFLNTTRYDRNEWNELLTWLSSL